MRTYDVQVGDSPALIAARFAGCPKCARDLVLSNPQKPAVRLPNGFLTFQSLRPGERLAVPDKWASKHFDELPPVYFSALPAPDGVTPSRLGALADGVLGNFATLDTAIKEIAELSTLVDAEFAAGAGVVASLLQQAMSDVIKGGDPVAVGHAQEVLASLSWAGKRAQEMAVAYAAGDSAGVAQARQDISKVLATAIDSARSALSAHYSSIPLPPAPVTVSVPTPAPKTQAPSPAPASTLQAAVQALLAASPCAPTSAAAVCAAQTVLGLSPDGKYGETTASAVRAVIPNAPPACNPRPAWWSPAGQRNCPGAGAVTPAPSSPAVTPPTTEKKGISAAGVVGLTVVGAGVVGAAIYLSLNPNYVKRVTRRL